MSGTNDHSSLTVVALKAELKKRGLPQSGLKKALVERLVESDREAEDASSQTVNNHDTTESSNTQADPVVEETREDPKAPVVPEILEAPKPTALESIPQQVVDDVQQNSQTTPSSASPSLSAGVDDSKKRKRRSQSPRPSTIDVAKKTRQIGASKSDVVLKEDLVETPVQVEEAQVSSGAESGGAVPEETNTKKNARVPHSQTDEKEVIQTAGNDVEASIPSVEAASNTKQTADTTTDAQVSTEASSNVQNHNADSTHTQAPSKSPISSQQLSSPKDTRFKDIFGQKQKPSDQGNKASTTTQDRSNDAMDTEEDRPVTPAIHTATPALYIRDFMRPLQPSALQRHLVSLATQSGKSPDPECLKDFHLDSVRTHCLVLFTTISAASRVRSALHQQVWPDERTRKPLWVDFIPEDKIATWIETEKASSSGPAGRSISGPRWEVVYINRDPRNPDSTSIEAIHQEIGAAPHGRVISGAGRGVQGAPSGPRRDRDTAMQDADHESAQQRGRDIALPSRPVGSGFVALDTLFRSTVAKPKLYFLPVSPQLSSSRLDAFAKHAPNSNSRGRSVRGSNELKHYSFEDGDIIVDRGNEPDYSARGGYRGRGGGGGGGGGYGPPRRGGGWRDNGYRGGPNRRY